MNKRKQFNEKIWYRGLKVLFAGTYIVTLALTSLILFEDGEWKEINQRRTNIVCSENKQINNQKVSFSAKEHDVYISLNDFENGQFKYSEFYADGVRWGSHLATILKECYPDTAENINTHTDTLFIQRISELKREQGEDTFNEMWNDEFDRIVETPTDERVDILEFSHEIFTIEPKYSYVTFLAPILIAILIISVIWETARRLFYYIACGSFYFKDYKKTLKSVKDKLKK